MNRGFGILALFTCASGTGKTMTAEFLAYDLYRKQFRIDLLSIVTKYIGETEKNRSNMLPKVEDVGAMLLFDEGNALFGNCSIVWDLCDRYANIEISYLV